MNIKQYSTMFMNLLGSLFGGSQGKGTPDRPWACKDVSEKASKYSDDIKALTEKYGELKTGLCIEIELSELLNVIPRERRRIDAYRGLISHLHEKYGVTLTIKSRKTH